MHTIEHLRLSGQLPSPKGVALAIMEICRHDDASLDDIARVVQADPALSARLLRLANPASYAGRPVVSIPEALMRLGMVAVRQVAIASSLVDQYPNGRCTAFDYPGFWSHSLPMAVALQELGQHNRIASPDELFSCGLMARIGSLALSTVYPTEYAQLLERVSAHDGLAVPERLALQVDHTELTVAMLADCGVPKDLVEPVSFHEAPQTSGFTDGSRPHQLAHLFYHAKRVADLGLAQDAQRNAIISELMLLGGENRLERRRSRQADRPDLWSLEVMGRSAQAARRQPAALL